MSWASIVGKANRATKTEVETKVEVEVDVDVEADAGRAVETKVEVEVPNIYAYVWLMMRGDFYLPGIIASVYSVLVTRPDADLVVMVTSDVSNEAKSQITKLGAKVHVVEYLSFPNKFRLSDKAHPKYSSWIDVSYTKWNCLKLPYKKIFLLDADVLAMRNLDDVFRVMAPAGHFLLTHKKTANCAKLYPPDAFGISGYLRNGTIVDPATINNILQTKDVQLPMATGMLLKPSIAEYQMFVDAINTLEDNQFVNETGPDEQAIAYFQSICMGRYWTHLSVDWNAFSKYKNPHRYKIIHYIYGNKPWTIEIGTYSDVDYWHQVYEKACVYMKESSYDFVVQKA